ncbi:MAG: hypothetical protein IPJ26_18635 [Bacteroidetes bacterium]|nr:hypothetical protein [Bacteroidota bacterium]
MIRFLKRKEIDVYKWDECIAQSKDGQAFYFTWYLDTCCEQWGALVEGNYETVFPFAYKNKLGIEYIHQAFFIRHYGVISKSEITENKRIEFLNAIPEEFKYLDFCLHENHHEIPADTKSESKFYQKLSLRNSHQEIRKGYNENLVRNLKKAEKKNLHIQKNFAPELLVDSFKEHQKIAAEKFNDSDYQTLLKLMQASSINAIGTCWAVQDPQKAILAAAFFIKTGNRYLYLKGFSSPEGRKQGAMHFLFDQFIRENTSQDIDLDFGGSSVKNIAQFFQSFGSDDCVYLRLQINRLPKALRWLKR